MNGTEFTIGQYGLALGILGLLTLMVKFILSLAKDVIKHSREQQELWRKTLEEFTSTLKIQHDQVIQAHRHQEIEHRTIVDSLGSLTVSITNLANVMNRINGVRV